MAAFVAAAQLLWPPAASCAVPLGYRYVGSRVVSGGRVVFWYWNVDYVEVGPHAVSFVARMYARAVDANQERPFVAVVRCDSKTYRSMDAPGEYQSIEDDEPIAAVWKAGCDKGLAVSLPQRVARLNATPGVPLVAAAQDPPSPPAPRSRGALQIAQTKAPPPTAAEPADPRRADACVRFAESRGAPAGDATIANACAYPIEVTLCYKGASRGPFDCATPAKGKYGDSLGPGVTHVLPEYRRGRNTGINAVACRGEVGSVFPRLDEGGKSGCY